MATDEFDPVEYARAEVAPLIGELCRLAEAEQELGQVRFFSAIRSGIENAADAEDLAGPFMELSTSAFLGFSFSPLAELILDRALGSAAQLAESLGLSDDEVH